MASDDGRQHSEPWSGCGGGQTKHQGYMVPALKRCIDADGYCAIDLCHPGDTFIQRCYRRRPCCRRKDDIEVEVIPGQTAPCQKTFTLYIKASRTASRTFHHLKELNGVFAK
ncbi:Hypothetical predicted protein [Podarcis lilfordi]|uniref:Uncharacterized protein n=1 Tax=Podarcis lilfordi TaxID=74358 RepID=A0AA35K4C6_9SAUR|nr:Hypothetical predicted protein [Podarcis lilfordi]